MKLHLILLAAGATLLTQVGFVNVANAQTYSIDWFTIDGGGGSSAGGQYQVVGTIGQPDASTPMTNSTYSLTGGFWSILAAVQTPGSPTLTIKPTGTNTAVISWPSSSAGFTLQQNINVGTTNWTDVPLTPADDGTTKIIVVPATPGNRFYRLKK